MIPDLPNLFVVIAVSIGIGVVAGVAISVGILAMTGAF